MRTQILVFLLIFSNSGFANNDLKIIALVQKAVIENAFLLIETDSSQVILNEIRYDEYYKTISATQLEQKTKTPEENLLKLKVLGFSELESNQLQIRIQDILHIYYIQEKPNNQKCQNQLIMSNGDTILVTVAAIDETRVQYKKCTSKDPRIYSKKLRDVEKILMSKKNEIIVQQSHLPKKKSRKFIRGALISSVIFTVIFILVTAFT